MKLVSSLATVGLLTVAAIAGTPSLTQAQVVECSTMENPVFLSGTTAVIPVIRLMGARLKAAHVTLLWNEKTDGCYSVSVFTRGGSTVKPVFTHYTEDPPGSGKTRSETCNGYIGQTSDLVVNDVPWTNCLLSYSSTGATEVLPAGFKEFLGPVQGLVPVVANGFASTGYNDIMSEELQNLYVCGGMGNILTFYSTGSILNYNLVYSGMPEMLARGIGLVNGSQMFTSNADPNLTAEDMVVAWVAPATSPEQTIGYTSTEFYDQYRDRILGLKVRGVNQRLAYLPDSDPASTDKLNVREGRYTLQGPLVLTAKVDANHVPTEPKVKQMIDWFLMNPVADPALQLPFDVLQVYALRGVVPQCAMKVRKDPDTQLFRRYRDPYPCHCKFQVLATGRPEIPGCVACVDTSTCQAGEMCSHGYCEPVP